MGERTQYTPGTFCWADLATTDQDGAKTFYEALFGWTADDRPVGDGAYYSMMQLDGSDVGAIAGQPDQQREAGVPPLWNSYVSVESADAVAERAGQLGATVHAPPFDVLTAGRMAVIQDPQGAFFMVWQPRDHFGATLVNAPGAIVWNELASPDLEGAQSFYGDLFGWKAAPVEGVPMTYYMIQNGEATNGGMREPMPPGTPPHWLVYFGTEDVERSLAKVEELGGAKLGEPFDMVAGKIGIARDPQGAVFALWAGQMQP